MATDPQTALTGALMNAQQSQGVDALGYPTAPTRTSPNGIQYTIGGKSAHGWTPMGQRDPFADQGANPYYQGNNYLTDAGKAWETANPNNANYLSAGNLGQNSVANTLAMHEIMDGWRGGGGHSTDWVVPFLQANPQYQNQFHGPNHAGANWNPYSGAGSGTIDYSLNNSLSPQNILSKIGSDGTAAFGGHSGLTGTGLGTGWGSDPNVQNQKPYGTGHQPSGNGQIF